MDKKCAREMIKYHVSQRNCSTWNNNNHFIQEMSVFEYGINDIVLDDLNKRLNSYSII